MTAGPAIRPSSGVRIRAMDRADLDQVVGIETAGCGFPWTRSMFEEEFRREHSRLRVAVDAPGRAVLGFACFWLLAGEIQILNLGVRPDHRREGIARRLVLDALRSGREAGIVTASLEVRSSNLAARALYERMGFAPAGRRPDYYEKPSEDALIMVLNTLSSRTGKEVLDG